jgi:hypothetical protein
MNERISSCTARDLAILAESEGTGEKLFATASRLTRDKRRREAWDAMHELEVQTRAGVHTFFEKSQIPVPLLEQVGLVTGVPAGATLVMLPWVWQMRAFGVVTRRFLVVFRRLAHDFEGTEAAVFFDYVVAHEKAIGEFAIRELSNEGGSIKPVRDLLGQVPEP